MLEVAEVLVLLEAERLGAQAARAGGLPGADAAEMQRFGVSTMRQ